MKRFGSESGYLEIWPDLQVFRGSLELTTIVTVHGTFAHINAPPVENGGTSSAGSPAATIPWWQKESGFGKLVAEMSGDEGANVHIEPFIWSGENSEFERRAAGAKLLNLLKDLEARGEPYSIVAHSHGGSVVSSALMQSIGRNIRLDGLRKWITVGTPFVELHKERYLFLRLPIFLKALFVASLMLLFMFLFFMLNDIAMNGWLNSSRGKSILYVISAVLASLPFIVFFVVAKFWDGRRLFFYRRRVIHKAHARYGAKWVGLCHEDDEVVQGLTSLKSVDTPIFHKNFAVPALSIFSVFLLPAAYLFVVFSPSIMVSLTDYLKANVYDVAEYERVEMSFRTARTELQTLRQRIKRLELEREEERNTTDVVKQLDINKRLEKLVAHRIELRKQLRTAYPNFLQLQRAGRFAQRFLHRDDEPCPGGTLCEGGHSLALNSRLLLHLVTDEASSFLVDEDVRWSTYGRIVRVAVPVILVPFLFGFVAIVLVVIVQFLARLLSAFASRQLDTMTWSQLRRSALGNDTESEIAVGASHTPLWVASPLRYLPPELGNVLTEHSNAAMTESLGKIRNAISDFAFSDRHSSSKAASVLSFLNWKELIHTSYFEVPEFRAFVAYVLANDEGFGRHERLAQHLDGATAARWFAALKPVAQTDSE